MQESLFPSSADPAPKKRGAKQKKTDIALHIVVNSTEEDEAIARHSRTLAGNAQAIQTNGAALPLISGELTSRYYKHRSLVEATGQIPIVAHRVLNSLLWYASQMSAMGLIGNGDACVIEMDTIIDKIGRDRVRSRAELWQIIVEVLKITIVFTDKSRSSVVDDPGNNYAFPVFSGLNFDSDEGVIRYHLSPFFTEVLKVGNKGLFDIEATRCLKNSTTNRLYELAVLEITCRNGDLGPIKKRMTFEEFKSYGLFDDWSGSGSQFLSKVIAPAARSVSKLSNVSIGALPFHDGKKVVGAEFEFALKESTNDAVMTADADDADTCEMKTELAAFGFNESEIDEIFVSRDPLDIKFAIDETIRKAREKKIAKTPYRYLKSFLMTGKAVLSDAEKVAMRRQKLEAAKNDVVAKRLDALFVARNEGVMKEFSQAKESFEDAWLSMSVDERREFYSKAIAAIGLPWMRKMKDEICLKDRPPELPILQGLMIEQFKKSVS
jgi:hypothetical protein